MPAADTARLIASLELQNKLGPGVQSALRDVGKLETRLGRIGAHAQRGVQNAATNLTRLGVVAGGLLASQVFVGVRSLEELERVTNATAGVIESTGSAAGVTAEEVRKMAEALEQVTTADDKVIQGGQNLLLTFTNIGEDTFPQATKAMVDMGIAMAQGDVASADFKSSAIQLGKALNDPVKGITALTRVGVSFTEEQKEQIKAMTEAGDVAGAQAIILKELEREFGNAGKAAGQGFGADMRRFEDAVEGAQQALAKGFLPLISRVSQKLQEKLSDPAVIRGIEEFGKGLADGFEQALEFAQRIPWATIGDAMRLAGQGAKAALDFFTSLPPWVQTAVITGWGLNKLTGGALGGIIGELGKGLIKGVLGMNAGIVNARAGVVNVAGGIAPGAAGAAGAGAAGAAGAGAAASKGGKLLGGAFNLLSKVFIVGMAAEAAAAFAEPINDLGKTIHEATGLNETPLNDFGAAWDKWRATADWPFGQRNAPEWAGGTNPNPFGTPPGGMDFSPRGPLAGGGGPVEVTDKTTKEAVTALGVTFGRTTIDVRDRPLHHQFQGATDQQKQGLDNFLKATHGVRTGISLMQGALGRVGEGVKAATVQSGIASVRAQENADRNIAGAVKLGADRSANELARTRTVTSTVKAAVDTVSRGVGSAKEAINAVKAAEERTKTTLERKKFTSGPVTIQNNLNARFNIEGRRLSQEIDRSTVVVRPAQAPVAS